MVAGVDEAGRGPLAGPVVAAAVVLPRDFEVSGLDDSKRLTSSKRDLIYTRLTSDPRVAWAVSVVSAEEIDRVNILRATHLAMGRAATQLKPRPAILLVDGLPVPTLDIEHQAVVGGDGLSYSIAAAAILAKVTRDRIMLDFNAKYPQYGFASHKGYGTRMHLERLNLHGPCPIHRFSFAPVAQRRLFPSGE